MVAEKEAFEYMEAEEMEVEDRDTDLLKEERLQRVLRRQSEFRTKKVVGDIVEELLVDVKAYRVTEMMGTMVEDFMNDAVELSTLGSMVRQVVEHGPEVRNRIEQRLREERLEEEAATRTILMEGEKEERLESSRRRQESWQIWYYYLQDEKLVRSLKKLELEEIIVMDVEEASQSMESGKDVQADGPLCMETDVLTLEMVTIGTESRNNEQEECICAVNCTTCQPMSQLDEDVILPEVGNNDEKEQEECICAVHCPGSEVEHLGLLCASKPVEIIPTSSRM